MNTLDTKTWPKDTTLVKGNIAKYKVISALKWALNCSLAHSRVSIREICKNLCLNFNRVSEPRKNRMTRIRMFRGISQVTLYRLMIHPTYICFRCYYLEFIITIQRIIRTNWTIDALVAIIIIIGALGGQRVKIWYLKKLSKIIFKSLIASPGFWTWESKRTP